MKQKQIRRGEIYYADLNPVIGSEQGDRRPVLVVQNDVGNRHSPTIVIVPLTCNLNKKSLPTHVFIPRHGNLEHDSLALVEQIRTIDNSRISEYIGCVTKQQQSEIDSALAVSIGLNTNFSTKTDILTLCLCPRCESDFAQSGCILVKKGWQDMKNDCDFCKVRQGLIFGIFRAEPNPGQ